MRLYATLAEKQGEVMDNKHPTDESTEWLFIDKRKQNNKK